MPAEPLRYHPNGVMSAIGKPSILPEMWPLASPCNFPAADSQQRFTPETHSRPLSPGLYSPPMNSVLFRGSAMKFLHVLAVLLLLAVAMAASAAEITFEQGIQYANP